MEKVRLFDDPFWVGGLIDFREVINSFYADFKSIKIIYLENA